MVVICGTAYDVGRGETNPDFLDRFVIATVTGGIIVGFYPLTLTYAIIATPF